MGKVPMPLLGQVDDLIGISDAGFRSEQLNSYVNVKAADKELQFGQDKCKTMLVLKVSPQNFLKPKLTVDTWELSHEKNGDMKEEYTGKAQMKEEVSLMYLGFMLSKKGTNIENIKHKGNRSIGVQKQIIKMIEPLGHFTFECALIYIQSLIRNSVLYSAEVMYSIKETEYRALESIEESVLLKVFATKKSCSRHLIPRGRYGN